MKYFYFLILGFACSIIMALAIPAGQFAKKAVAKLQNKDESFVQKDYVLATPKNNKWGISAEFHGDLDVLLKDKIVYDMESGTIKPNPDFGDKTLHIKSISLSLSAHNGPNGRWKPVINSEVMTLNRILKTGDYLSTGNFKFTIPLNDTINIKNCWLTMFVTTEDGSYFPVSADSYLR